MTNAARQMKMHEFRMACERAGCTVSINGGDMIVKRHGVPLTLRLNCRKKDVDRRILHYARRHFGIDT